MLPRIAQSLIVLLAAALFWFITARWVPPAAAAIVFGAIALALIIRILIRPLTFDSWESFWESLAAWLWWW